MSHVQSKARVSLTSVRSEWPRDSAPKRIVCIEQLLKTLSLELSDRNFERGTLSQKLSTRSSQRESLGEHLPPQINTCVCCGSKLTY